MNSMHNSFNGPGGYSGNYSGYVPPPSAAMPYYNGYSGEQNQCSTPYYGKPAGASSIPPNYGIGTYASSINNSSMYYQQYGVGYQYGYGKYGISYPGEPNAHHPNINSMQPSASTELGPIGSMFSKSKFSEGQSSSSPHSSSLGRNQSSASILSPATSNTPSPGAQNIALNFKGSTATPSPPVDGTEIKKDFDKMKKCQICGQVFHLMSDCLAHMKAVHDNPSEVYVQQMTNQGQSNVPGNSLPGRTMGSPLPHPPTRYSSSIAPDSPLTALEKMGWGEKQASSVGVNQAQNQLPLGAAANGRNIQEYGMQYSPHITATHSVQRLSSPSVNSISAIPAADRNAIACTSSHMETPLSLKVHHPTVPEDLKVHPAVADDLKVHYPAVAEDLKVQPSVAEDLKVHHPAVTEDLKVLHPAVAEDLKVHPAAAEEVNIGDGRQRKFNSYSVSSIIGEPVGMNAELQRKFASMNNYQEKHITKTEYTDEVTKVPDEKSEHPEPIMSNVPATTTFMKGSKFVEHKEKFIKPTIEPIVQEHTVKNENKYSCNDKMKSEHEKNSQNPLTDDHAKNNQSVSECDQGEVIIKLSSSDTHKHVEIDENIADTTLRDQYPTNEGNKSIEKNESPNQTTVTARLEKGVNERNPTTLQEPDQTKAIREADKPINYANMHQMALTQQARQPHPTSMPNVYPNSAVKQTQYGNWPMNTGYPGHYPYPNNQHNHAGTDGCLKQHGYAMQPRYPHYQQAQICVRNTGQDHSRDSNMQGYIQGHPPSGWYPTSSRNEGKPTWGNWSNQTGGPYSQGYYGYPAGSPQGQKTPSNIHTISSYPSGPQHSPSKGLQQVHITKPSSTIMQIYPKPGSQTVSQPSVDDDSERRSSLSDTTNDELVQKAEVRPYPKIISDTAEAEVQVEKHIFCQTDVDKGSKIKPFTGIVKKTGPKIGPKSKTLMAKQINYEEEHDNNDIIEQENGIDGDASQSATSQYDSSDSEMVADEGPTYAVLKTLKKRGSITDKDVFVGPKRIKLAKLVHERQKKRERHMLEQIHQSEIEERLQAERAEKLSDQEGPLANIIFQSSIILADLASTSLDSMEVFMASMNDGKETSNAVVVDDCVNEKLVMSSYGNSMSIKKPFSKKPIPAKVFHNENSVLVKHSPHNLSMKKLRAKDFKWSHYIKTMRFWCNDCAQGFKNQKEANAHTEDKCKLNCLYMLECYVVVKDVQTHPEYGPKVQVLLEEYQVDGKHSCTTCGDVIARKSDFVVHTDTHKDFMPWECTICGTRFKIRGSLKEHLRYTHMKGRVPCLKCNKVFPTSTLLRQHVKVHTQHYKYKSGKNRKDELRVAMEATAGAIEPGMNSPEENDRLSSQEANEYRSWCKLMEMNAMKNIATYGTGLSGTSFANNFDEDFDEKDEGNMSSDDLVHLDSGHGELNDSMSS